MRIANQQNGHHNVRTQNNAGLVPPGRFVRRGWRWRGALIGTLGICAACAVWAGAAQASSFEVIYSLGGDEDGEYTDTDLVIDPAGSLYGTSVQGGAFGGGTVFQLTPSGTGWTHTVLYSFTGGADGGEPYKGVTLDAHGNLYGTAVTGGSGVCEGGCGVAFKLTKSGTTWTQSVIHAFAGGNDGSGPGAGLAFDKGNLYGMTATGGDFGLGVIYKLHQDQSGNWTESVIHSFTGGTDGSSGSAGRLISDQAGNLYGVATTGGANGQGTAFELVRSQNGNWKFKTLYAFKGDPDAGFPYGALVFDASGNLYGTTYYDGANDLGAVYQLISTGTGKWKEKVLYSFQGGNDSNSSIGNLVIDGAGNLYGTTSEGGVGFGTIFKVTRNANGKWIESVVHSFQSVPDGAFAYNGMIPDGLGNFFGATVHGGASNDGAIYKFTP